MPKKIKAFESSEIYNLLTRRSKAIESLVQSLAYLSTQQQFVILTGWYSIEQLEEIALFETQEYLE